MSLELFSDSYHLRAMEIPLDSFEEVIDKRMLERGLKYYEDGAVDEPVEMEAGLYEAVVQGSDDYTVRVRSTGDAIIEHDCDCQYDMGPVCKHVVALIFQLRDEPIGSSSPEKGGKAGKKPTVAEQVDGALASVSRDVLNAFVRERCMADAAFRQHFW